MDKQNMVHTHNEILFSFQKEENSDMVEPWGHYIKWNKPVTKNKYYMNPLIWGT